YNEALGFSEYRRISEDDFTIVFLTDGSGTFALELTWIKEHPQPYELGECEFHLAVLTDDYETSLKKHTDMGCVCYNNEEMGLYFISDPDGYWIEIIPAK
ncbi:MAG: lactoylglutathione lyase, partial [Oscillospiraceae bacterium]|nr:lactoylglutathione lyase [Oscillospiraceae bacterium]